MPKFVAILQKPFIMRFDEINKKAYHFTLERQDPNNENVPECSYSRVQMSLLPTKGDA